MIIPIGDEPPCNGGPGGPAGSCSDADVDAIANLINVAEANDVLLVPITGYNSSTDTDCTVELWDSAASTETALHVDDFQEGYEELGEELVSVLAALLFADCPTCFECDHGPCPADFNDDNEINVLDLLILLENWGACANPNDCPWDLNCDGEVNVLDLLILLESWGTCQAGLIPPETIEDCYERYPDNIDHLIACIEMIEEIEIYNGTGNTNGGD